MTDTPATSSANEPADIDIAAAREAFTERIGQVLRDEHIHRMDPLHRALIDAVTELYALLESETRRIDNELTQAVAAHNAT